jgi:hypothetical protein
MKYELKRNDTAPAITATLTDENGVIVLTGATVRFKLAAAPESGLTFTPINRVCTVTNATKGQVSFAWQAGDTTQAGIYRGEFEVTFAGGSIETYPAGEYLDIIILPDLA